MAAATERQPPARPLQRTLHERQRRHRRADSVRQPTGLATGWSAALEAQHTSKLFVNDANTDAAAAVKLLNARVGWGKAIGDWRIDTMLRVDNLTDRRYAGSVIVNEGNGRFFEPGLPRRISGWIRAFRRI